MYTKKDKPVINVFSSITKQFILLNPTMEKYLKDSNKTRSIEQKVYELDIQRYKFIIENYKKQLEQISQLREEYENQNKNTIEDVKNLQEQFQEVESQKINTLKELEKITKQFSVREKKLNEEIEDLQKELTILKNDNQKLQETSTNESTKEIKKLKNEIKELKKKVKEEENETIKTLRDKIKVLEESKDDKKKQGNAFDDYKERCKILEKEISQLILENKKKEEEWFESIISQNTKLLEKIEKFDCFNLILKEITNLGKHIKQQENKGDINYKDAIKEIIETHIGKGDDLKDKTIRTLKASNELKSKIIKKQEEKISKKKEVQDSSDETIIKPEEDEANVVFGMESQPNNKVSKIIKESSLKKTKLNPFDEAVLKASKPKKDNKKTITMKKDTSTKRDQLKSEISKINTNNPPIVKKAHLPSDAPKLNNASFFANITFTDSSPVIKKDQKK